jgi:hypothetical protein
MIHFVHRAVQRYQLAFFVYDPIQEIVIEWQKSIPSPNYEELRLG